MKKSFGGRAAAGLVVSLALAISACGASTNSGESGDKSLTVAIRADVSTLDPHHSASAYDRSYYYAMYNTLLQTNDAGDIVPELAESYETADDSILLKLREDVQFQDGTPFNAEAVKFNIERQLDPAEDSIWQGQLSAITSVQVVDEFQVKLVTSRPDPTVLWWLADRPGMMVSPAAVKKEGKDFALKPVGTGPFTFVSRTTGGPVKFTRNENYWKKGLPKADSVELVPMVESSSRVSNLLSGSVDVIDSYDLADVNRLSGNNAVRTVPSSSERYTVLHLNTTKPPFDKLAAREAVAYAVDYEEIHQAIYYGQGSVPKNNSALPPTNWAFNGDVRGFSRDLDKAKEKLAEAGLPNGFSFVISPQDTPFLVQLAELLSRQLGEVGITAEINPLELSTWTSTVLVGGDSEAGLQDTAGREAGVTIPFFIGGNTPYGLTGWAPDAFDDAVTKANSTYDRDQRKTFLGEAQELVANDVPELVLHLDPQQFAMSASLAEVDGRADGALRVEDFG